MGWLSVFGGRMLGVAACDDEPVPTTTAQPTNTSTTLVTSTPTPSATLTPTPTATATPTPVPNPTPAPTHTTALVLDPEATVTGYWSDGSANVEVTASLRNEGDLRDGPRRGDSRHVQPQR